MQKSDVWQWVEKGLPEGLPDDLSITITAQNAKEQAGKLQALLEMQHIYKGAIGEIRTKLETLDSEFRVRFEHNPIHHIDSRLKSPQSIIEKMRRKGLKPSFETARESLQDIAGVRVICNYVEDVYDIAGMLEKQQDITLIRRRDYIASPKENGYRSLHLIVMVPVFLSDRTEQVPVEVQFRTIAMDFWATLEHELRYKATSEVEESLRERLKQCAENSAALDREMQDIRNSCIRQGNTQ